MFDLLLKGGRVVDPSTSLDGLHDIAVQDGKIARIAADIPASDATRVVEVAGKIVTPGLIDLHAHVFEGVNRTGVNPTWPASSPASPPSSTRGARARLPSPPSRDTSFPTAIPR